MDHLELPWRSAHESQRLVVVLVRHGQTEWNASKRFLGRTDIPLDEVGLAQAHALAQALPKRFDAAYTSPLSRAARTAEVVFGPHACAVPDFQELSQGELEGLTGPQAFAAHASFFEQWKSDPADVHVPGGESLRELQVRATRSLNDLAKNHVAGQVIGVFTHQMVIATLTCAAVEEPLSRWREHCVPNTAMTVLANGGSGWQLLASGLSAGTTDDG
jgi:broad specificity phosphatase PhoE